MKKCCLFISVMLMCFLCACSVTEQKERTTMYDIIESGSAEEIAAAAEAAVEKHDELFNLAMDEMSAWNSYADGTGAEDALKSAQAAMVDFFVEEGFSADEFGGTVEEAHNLLTATRESLSDEYIAISTRYSEILKDEAVENFKDAILSGE